LTAQRKIALAVNPRLLKFGMNLWPPFRGAGIRVRHIAPDYSQAIVSLRLGFTNRNYFGAHFGGSLYAMTDPFFAILATNRLGRDYTVAHKSGMIDYLEVARGTVTATLNLTDAQIADVMLKTASGQKYLPTFATDIVDDSGRLVARATHMLHIRRRSAAVEVTVGEQSARSTATHADRWTE
jgi:acyl-coenzyme A thioesterase PaaI-like protein